MTGREGRLFVLGRIEALRGCGSVRGYAAAAGYGGRVFDQTTSDGTGRFLLEIDRGAVRELEFVDIYVSSASGARVGARRLRVIDLDSPQVFLLKAIRNMDLPTLTATNSMIKHFTANGERAVLVDSSCSQALLEWEVEGSRVSDPEDLQLMLTVDRQPIARDLSLRGNLQVREKESAEYLLTVKRRSDPGTTLDRQMVTVRRFPTLSLYFEDPPRRHESFRMGVALSCPASEGGLIVSLVSSDQSVMADSRVAIQSGETQGMAVLALGARPGRVEVTGLASGYLRDSVSVTIPEE